MELELLPDYVLIEIFRGLSAFDLVNYRRVSKRWFHLISSPKYFQRAHRLFFAGCTLSATCPPLSVFKTSFSSFFKYLTIDLNRVKLTWNIEENDEWVDAWSQLGTCITHLKFSDYVRELPGASRICRVLGDGCYWSQLIELEVEFADTNFPRDLKIVSLKTLKLRRDSSNYLEQNFPNLINLNLGGPIPSFNRTFTDWELQRLKKIECFQTVLSKLKTDSIESLSLHYNKRKKRSYQNDKQIIESFIRRQKCLSELKMYGFKEEDTQRYWNQLTGLTIYICYRMTRPLRDYLTGLRNLRNFKLIFGSETFCFFGHESVDFPCLETYFISARPQCENCWKSCLESFSNVTDGAIYDLKNISKYLSLLKNLQHFKTNMIHCLKSVDEEETLRNVLELHCDNNRLEGHLDKQNFKEIVKTFPKLRRLDIFAFDPIILQSLPELQHLCLNIDSYDQKMIEDMVQFGTNLRVIRIKYRGLQNVLKEEEVKYLFDNLKLLVQVSTPDNHYTRSSII